jgi:hypothetical protein
MSLRRHDDEPTRNPFQRHAIRTMFADAAKPGRLQMKLDDFSNDRSAELRAWVHLWLDEATRTGLASTPRAFDDTTLTRALALHRYGFDPVDAVSRLFGTLH